MRNRIAHDYRTVDDDIVWEVVTEHVPALGNVIAKEIEHARQLLA